ncbi:MAG: phytanoyl-CoA dioxygenase [Candidatus Latescibacteria bacterium]|nr:phytanoyl-CoA dioxygenase [Candidatus Latescibacterota bacterium]
METNTASPFTYRNHPLDRTGPLRASTDARADRAELHRRMEQDGYLFLPGLLDRQQVLEARGELLARLAKRGLLASDADPLAGVAAPGAAIDASATGALGRTLSQGNPHLDQVLYAGPMLEFYRFFLDGPVRHFDFTWFRAKPPGGSQTTTPHCDIVFMGRGTKRLYTSWTPFGDVPLGMGGLMVLENSHRQEKLKNTYGAGDVDLYCTNEGEAEQLITEARRAGRDLTSREKGRIRWDSSGAYSHDAVAVQNEWDGRWLTGPYQMGDVLIFSMYLMHASSDNHTNRIRLSSDTRYQRADEPIDERWIGANPARHGIGAKRGTIC